MPLPLLVLLFVPLLLLLLLTLSIEFLRFDGAGLFLADGFCSCWFGSGFFLLDGVDATDEVPPLASTLRLRFRGVGDFPFLLALLLTLGVAFRAFFGETSDRLVDCITGEPTSFVSAVSLAFIDRVCDLVTIVSNQYRTDLMVRRNRSVSE